MTGLLDRLRAWLGSPFGGGTADADDAAESASASTTASDQPAPQVVHRDDRPLETPSTMDRTDPPTPGSQSGRETRVDIPDAEADVDGPGEETGSPEDLGRVSIPDAEATADESTGDVTPTPAERSDAAASTADEGAESTADEGAASTADEGAESTTTSEIAADQDDSTDTAFACSVCGTAVDDPSEPCPLCRSTDVVPAGGDGDGGTPMQSGRTAVSTTNDDEAVDRLHDVSDEG